MLILTCSAASLETPIEKKRIADLIAALKEDDPERRVSIELARIGRDAIPALLTALQDKNPKVRTGAAWALDWLQPPNKDVIPPLFSTSLYPALDCNCRTGRDGSSGNCLTLNFTKH